MMTCKCPHCHRELPMVVDGDKIKENAPVICSRCLKFSVVENGYLRRMTDIEAEAVKQRPSYETVIKPFIEGQRLRNQAKNARNN